MYRISEIRKARTDFAAVFNVPLGWFYDGLTTVCMGRICIDITKFDDYIHKLYGDYEDRGLSLEELIIEKYGSMAANILDKLL
ncbi:MAG: hypothetical protein LBC68_00860 [Prevotellaceae bacterium]|jgi:hypothetical protein|nr:hypothetical protein [Prevotellaceae bacterium]